MSVTVIANPKGGVGKSTLATNVAGWLARHQGATMLGDIETVLVHNEKDALLLENELIKKHKPRLNVLLKDDKQFISLRLDKTQSYPRLEVVRKYERDGARYFGPYSSAPSRTSFLTIFLQWSAASPSSPSRSAITFGFTAV